MSITNNLLRGYMWHAINNKHFDFNSEDFNTNGKQRDFSIFYETIRDFINNGGDISTDRNILFQLFVDDVSRQEKEGITNIQVIDTEKFKFISDTSDYNKKSNDSTFLKKYEEFNIDCQMRFNTSSGKLARLLSNPDYKKVLIEMMGGNLPTIDNNEEDLILSKTPTIPEGVYDVLPDFLKKVCLTMDDSRERDMCLTSTLTCLSSIFTNVKTVYYGSEIYPPLYSFIAAPAASGKQSIKYGGNLLTPFLNREREENNVRVKQDKEYNRKSHMLAGDSSQASFIEQLYYNLSKGLIFETEADVLTTVMKSDWGNYSTNLRKAFGHESISKNRKSDTTNFYIERPKLGVMISGTINQLFQFLPSSENGLFSRFLYYIFDKEPEWNSPFGQTNYDERFRDYSKELDDFVVSLYDKEYIFKLNDNQIVLFNEAFDTYLEQESDFSDKGFQGTVKRYANITMRIMMIFSMLRLMESQMLFSLDESNDLYCSDDDFYSSLKIIGIYLQHSSLFYANLNKEDFKAMKQDFKMTMFSMLPDEFTIEDVKKICINSKKKYAERTLRGHTKYFKDSGMVTKLNQKTWKKVKK